MLRIRCFAWRHRNHCCDLDCWDSLKTEGWWVLSKRIPEIFWGLGVPRCPPMKTHPQGHPRHVAKSGWLQQFLLNYTAKQGLETFENTIPIIHIYIYVYIYIIYIYIYCPNFTLLSPLRISSLCPMEKKNMYCTYIYIYICIYIYNYIHGKTAVTAITLDPWTLGSPGHPRHLGFEERPEGRRLQAAAHLPWRGQRQAPGIRIFTCFFVQVLSWWQLFWMENILWNMMKYTLKCTMKQYEIYLLWKILWNIIMKYNYCEIPWNMLKYYEILLLNIPTINYRTG